MATTVTSKFVTEVATEKTAVSLDKATAEIITEFVSTRDLINNLEKTKKELEAKIKEVLGDAEVGVLDGKIRIEVSKRNRTGVSTEVLKTAYPEAYEASKTSTDYVVLVVK
jgi:predicted phage-related endonuclease